MKRHIGVIIVTFIYLIVTLVAIVPRQPNVEMANHTDIIIDDQQVGKRLFKPTYSNIDYSEEPIEVIIIAPTIIPTTTPTTTPTIAPTIIPTVTPVVERTISRSVVNNDLDLLSRLIMAEAGGESYACKVAVGEVVVNRVQSGRFPDTIKEVIYQSGQFSVVKSGSIKRSASDSAISAAKEVLRGSHTIPDNVLFFRASYFFSDHKRYKSIDNTYFSY